MKIAILTPLYEPSVGGVQETMRLFAEYFASQGAQVRVYTSQRRSLDELKLIQLKTIRHALPHQFIKGVEIFRAPCGGFLDTLLGIFYAVSFRARLPFTPNIFNVYQSRMLRGSYLVREIQKHKPDVLLVAPCVDYLMQLSEKTLRGCGAILYVQTSLHLDDDESKMDAMVQKLACADGILVNTDFEQNYLIRQGIDAEKISFPSVGVDVESFTLADQGKVDARVVRQLSDKRYVLYFGRKQNLKGIDALVEAFRSLRKDYTDVYLVLAGEETDYYREKIKPHVTGKTYIVEFKNVDLATKRWLYAHACFFSMVSSVDSFGIVYCESWLSKRPVLAADNGQMRCVVQDKEDGFLVPAENPIALATAMKRWLDDPALADKMGERGYQKVMRLFGGHAVEKKVFELIQGYGIS